MDTRTRRASWDAATDGKQPPGFQIQIGIPEVRAVDRVDNHAKASSYGIRLRR